ncbi:MAG: insulinase family protein, partial [Lachnospiraceae bacterium]|nr:insulinase family protein [Lachnospiraceae bacterium]
TGALLVLKMIFSYEYLWTNIRVKGGAYGCACTFGTFGIGYFTSYRDPNLKNTYEVYKKAAEFVEQFDVDERTMTKYIIGAISSLDMPLTPSAYASQSFAAYLSGLTTEQKQKERDEVLGTNVEKIRELAPIVKAVYDTGAFAALGNTEKITQQAELFDKVVTLV